MTAWSLGQRSTLWACTFSGEVQHLVSTLPQVGSGTSHLETLLPATRTGDYRLTKACWRLGFENPDEKHPGDTCRRGGCLHGASRSTWVGAAICCMRNVEDVIKVKIGNRCLQVCFGHFCSSPRCRSKVCALDVMGLKIICRASRSRVTPWQLRFVRRPTSLSPGWVRIQKRVSWTVRNMKHTHKDLGRLILSSQIL